MAVGNFRGDGVRVLGFPPPVVENMEKFGHDAIADTMRAVGVSGWGTRKAPFVGRYYAHAGAFMRIAQTDRELPVKTKALAADAASRWPFQEYVQGAVL